MNLTTSDIIQLIGILTSLITSIIAIIISVLTLRQNSKMIAESTRPYVVIYSKTTNFQSPALYIIVKNFGQTGATISSIKSSPNIANLSMLNDRIPFDNFSGTFISPGQSFICNIKTVEFYSQKDPLDFQIDYEANGKKYHDEYSINPNGGTTLVNVRAATTGKELRTISYTLQDLVEKQL